jgi:hypothetical protein
MVFIHIIYAVDQCTIPGGIKKIWHGTLKIGGHMNIGQMAIGRLLVGLCSKALENVIYVPVWALSQRII